MKSTKGGGEPMGRGKAMTCGLVVGVLTSWFLLPEAEASCGLDYCPAPSYGAEATGRWRVSEAVQVTAFSLDSMAGHYVESITRAGYTTPYGLGVGAFVPVIALNADGGDVQMGLGNVTGYVELSRPVGEVVRIRGGTQLETPTSTHDSFASAHLELLPYLGVSMDHGRFRFQAETGFRLALGAHDHSDSGTAAPMPSINPHGDREFVYQAIADVGIGTRFRSGVTVRGQQVLSHAEHRSFVTAGGQLSWRVTDDLDLSAVTEAPVIRPARLDLRMGVQASAAF